jgi:glutamine synthetase
VSGGALESFRRIRVELPDVEGSLRGKVVPAKKAQSPRGLGICDIVYCFTLADEVFEGPLCNPSTGFPDVVLMPDISTLRPVPWEPGMGAVLADVLTKDGDPYPLCAREAVRRSERRLGALGLEARMAIEFEIFVFRRDSDAAGATSYDALQPISRLPNAYSLLRWPDLSRFAAALFDDLGEYGVDLDMIHTEMGQGAIEVALAPASPLHAADQAARFKLGCKEIAARHDLVPTFMAKWNAAEAGSSGHIHQSLWRDGESASLQAPGQMTAELTSYLEGMLATTADFSAFFGPNMNSYRRPDPVLWAPTTATWGFDNRTACCRVRAEDPESARIEHRRPGADLSIYYSIAACVGGGALGIENGLELRPEAPRDATLDPSAQQLPQTLREATDRLRESAAAREVFGDVLVEHYALSREQELREVERHVAAVPAWELARYFETV